MRLFGLALLVIVGLPVVAQKTVAKKPPNLPISPETIELIKHSVVPVVCGYQDDKQNFQISFIAGSGFFIDSNGTFLTANHVLDDWKKAADARHPCFPVVYIPLTGWAEYKVAYDIRWFAFSIDQCNRNPGYDLALCTPVMNPFTTRELKAAGLKTVQFDTTEFREGTNVAFTGFPLELHSPVTSIGHIGGFLDNGAKSFKYVVDKGAWPGASGSALFLSSGKVAGLIIQRGTNDGTGIALAQSSMAITEFINGSRPK